MLRRCAVRWIDYGKVVTSGGIPGGSDMRLHFATCRAARRLESCARHCKENEIAMKPA